MKRLVLVGEGYGEVSALPVLVRRLLQEKDAGDTLFVDHDVIREPSPVRWDKQAASPDYSKWVSRVTLAARRRDAGGVLAIYDGDAPTFPAGSGSRLLCGHRRPVHDRCRWRRGRGQGSSPWRWYSLASNTRLGSSPGSSPSQAEYQDGRPACHATSSSLQGNPNLMARSGSNNTVEAIGRHWIKRR